MFQDDDLRRDMDNDMELVFGSGQLASCNFDSEDSDDPLATKDECDAYGELWLIVNSLPYDNAQH